MNKKTVSQIIFEFVSIVFAVLLALGLSTYKNSIDLKNESLNVRNNIIEEFRSNLSKVDSVLLNNQQYTKYLD